MTINDVILYIIIPLVSAVIGGGLTLVGVLITTKHETKIRTEEKISNNEPLFYIFDPLQQFDSQGTQEYHFFPKNEKTNGSRGILFKNTDKTYIVLDSIRINSKYYYPKIGKVVNKNEMFTIRIYSSENYLTNKDTTITLNVRDILGNKYSYKILYDIDEDEFIAGIPEKISITNENT